MDGSDISIRNCTYRRFVELGRAPTTAEVASAANQSETEILSSWQRLHDQHALVLNGSRDHIRMANPFSAIPTAYRVRAGDRWWYGNCAWDAFGICAALHSDGRIEASCPDCGDPIPIEVSHKRPDRDDLVFYCAVPAARWWDDIVFT